MYIYKYGECGDRYIYICQVHPLGPFHLYLLTLLALLCRLLVACLWLSVLQYWLQFIGNCTYQLVLGNFDCKPLRIVCVWLVISGLLGHCQDYHQHKLSKLFNYILQVVYVCGFGHHFEKVTVSHGYMISQIICCSKSARM